MLSFFFGERVANTLVFPFDVNRYVQKTVECGGFEPFQKYDVHLLQIL